MGYVGLPLAAAIADAGFHILGFDIDAGKVAVLNGGESYIASVTNGVLHPFVKSGQFQASADFARLDECDVVVICVPTPLTRHREPDLSFVEETARSIARTLRPGQLTVL